VLIEFAEFSSGRRLNAVLDYSWTEWIGGVAMTLPIETQPVLTEQEWNLIVELLKRAQSELPVEIHHTHSRAYRKELQGRLQLVEQLLERLGQTVNV
jgi:hypothetical protein